MPSRKRANDADGEEVLRRIEAGKVLLGLAWKEMPEVLGVHKNTLQAWLYSGRTVPAKALIRLERAVRAHQLDPFQEKP